MDRRRLADGGATPTKHVVERLCLLGRGRTSEVFAWGKGRVLKLCESWVTKEQVQNEYTITRSLHAAGLHVPATYELVELNGRHGIVFERIYGISLQEQVQARPWTLFSAARQLAELHAYIHGNVAPKELPSQRHQLKRWIEVAEGVSPSQRQAAYDCIDSFPDANMLCHGDFHAGSIILGVRGPVIIDWMTAARGHPLADVARTSLLFQGPGLPRDMGVAIRLLFKISRKLLHKIYLKRYLQIHNGTHGEIDSWRLPQRIAMSAGRALRSRLSKPGFRTGK